MKDSFEVIDGLLRKKPVSRMGIHDAPWGDTLGKWAREEGYPKNADGHALSPTDVFDFDMIGVGGWFDAMPLRGHSEVLQETDEWVVKRNGAGAAFKNWKHKSGTPEHIDFRMSSRAVWERDYRPHLLATDPLRVNVESAKRELERRRAEGRWTYFGHLFIWELMRCSMGDVGMFESLILDPDWIRDFNRVYTDFFKAHYTLLFAQAGKPDGVWIYEDLGYSKGLFCSPRILDELIFPYYREMVEFFHGYDLPVVLHSCGGITEGLDLVAGAGFDALNPMEAKAGCDVVDFARRFGDRLAFMGGMDARIFESGDRPRIRNEVIRLCRSMRDAGARYVFGSDHSISTNVKLADFRYAVDVFRDHMAY